MSRRRRPAPLLELGRDTSGRSLPGVVAVMVALAVLAMAGALMLDSAGGDWQAIGEDRLLVQIDAIPGTPTAPRLEAALAQLRATPGVASAQAMPQSGIANLLRPWLGDAALLQDLPLPGVIEVRLQSNAAVDRRALAVGLEAAVAGARVDDPRAWLAQLSAVSESLRALGFAVVAAIALATIAMIVFATNAGLGNHHETIAVLHTIGARDQFIAAQFQWHILALALRGAIVGLALAALVAFAVARTAGDLQATLLPPMRLSPTDWAGIVAIPVISVVLAALTARLTVMRALRREV
ncbi:MAG: FtsX-like permease family protein [Sneathiellaceae bacterium]